MMTYKEAEEYLESLNGLGSIPGLSSICGLLKRLKNPEKSLSCVHISGTNGKGSVGAYICNTLVMAGLKVGRYTSPAVFDPLETITLNQNQISEEDFALYLSLVRDAADLMVKEGLQRPTRFETETALMFLYFSQKDCDIVLIECGMGGMLDATNVLDKPLLSIITSISMDHMNFLGNSLSEIACHKAGIIKRGCPVVSAPCSEEVKKVIDEKCRECATECVYVPCSKKPCSFCINNLSFIYKGEKYDSRLTGLYQVENASVAIEGLRILEGLLNVKLPIREGIKSTVWDGRFSVLGQNPLFIMDGAHNEGAAVVLQKCLKEYFSNQKITFIIGIFADKDYEKILDLTLPFAKKVILINTPNNQRALNADKLRAIIKEKYNMESFSFQNIEKAVEFAYNITDKEGAIIAFGSLSHLKYIKEAQRRFTHDR